MGAIIVVIIAFLIVLYVSTYLRYKKRKKTEISAIDAFKAKYSDKNTRKLPENKKDQDIKNYITKYNSSVDYVSREDFLKENTTKKLEEDKVRKPRKKLQY